MFDSKSHTRPRCAPTRRPRRCPTLRLDGLEDRSTPTVLAVTAVADNTLYEDPAGQLSNGAGQHLYVGKTGLTAGEKVRRAVLQFDLSAVPAGSTINSAQLTLHVSRPNNGAQTVEVHRLTAAWGEGSSNAAPGGEGDGAQATTGDATWLHRFFNSQMWATPGGDFAATASASQSINAIGGYNWTGGGLTADVQQWLSNPTTNHGWILLGNESASQTAKELESRESLTAANRPTLTIDYTAPSPDLTIDKTHVGDFTQGDLADTYVITVSNVGAGPTSGTITVTDILPAGLSPTAADNGTINGWNVSFAGQTITATRSNALAAGNSYPALTLTVAVAASAPASVTNTATVSGGGQVNTTNDSDSDPTTIQPVADLTIAKTHSGDFTQGDTNRTYTITVSNPGPGPTRGAVTVTDALPTGLTPTAANSGTINGWTVSRNGQTVTATRNDTLASGLSYPALSLIADVDFDAPASVVNTAAVSGGGELNTANDIASDPTTIQPNVTPNQPPVNTLPATFATAEDIALTLSGLSVVDPDAGGGNVKVTLAVTSGTLLLSTTVGGGVAAGQVTGNGTGTLVVTASLSAINATLANANGLRFTPAENASGPVTLTMTTDDLGHNGTGGPLTDTDTASMAVSALNDAPVNTLPPTSSTPADTPLSLSGISIADVDAGANPVSVVLNVTTGKLTVNTSVTGAVTAANVTGNGSGLVTLFAPLAAVNTTLAAATGLIFTPPPAFAGTAILTVVTNDLGNSGPGGALSDSDTETITVTRVLDHFSINVPAGSIAGVPFDATVTARDATGNVIANYGGSVDLVTSDAQGSLPPSATFTAGVATFSVTLKTAGAQTVTATDTAIPAVTVQGTVAVSPAVGARLTFEQQPTGTLAGAPFRPAIRVSARDAFGNLVTTDTSDAVTVRLQNNPTGATLGGTTSARLVDGVATFPMLQINKPGSGFTLVAAAAGLPAAVSSPFSVAAVTRFVVTASQPTTTAGTGLTVTVRALDARGQVVANYAGQVHFTSTDPQALLPADGTLTNGEGSFPVTLRTAGPRTIIIADIGKPTVRGSLARSVTVTPAAVSALRATGLTAPTPAGQRQTLTVAAVDAFGNINPGYRGTVTLTSTDSAALLPPAYTFTARDAGKHAFGVTLRTVGLRTITISDGTLTAERANILVAGPAAAVLSQPDPGDPAKTALVAIGTAGNDLIEVAPTNLSGTQIEVRVNGLSQGSAFAPTGHLLLYGLGGNDSIQLRTGTGTLAGVQLAMPVVIDAGAGNDAVDAAGSAGPAVVLGRDGNDVLSGGAGRDLLVGGRGLDNLRGAAGDDILIAGPTTLEPDLTGLLAVMAEWSDAGTDFVTRVRHLSGVTPGGANGPYLLKAATVQSDPSIDQLAGGADRDWFLFTAAGRTADRLLDVADGEMVTGL